MAYGFPRYVPAAARRRKAEQETARLRKRGSDPSPVLVGGRRIARTFWGESWCRNLERYSDYANRLPRGRTYVRSGAVVDLQITRGRVESRVAGTHLYRIRITVSAVPEDRWQRLCKECAGGIDSVVELLQGRLSKAVMEPLCREQTGLFPSPAEIAFECSCPDWASMCKHVAATLYGVGARLDHQPELLFLLRGVDQNDLIAKAGSGLAVGPKKPRARRILAEESLSEMFGIEIAETTDTGRAKRPKPAKKSSPSRPRALKREEGR
jgi:uncharacterized Zn finger protein